MRFKARNSPAGRSVGLVLYTAHLIPARRKVMMKKGVYYNEKTRKIVQNEHGPALDVLVR